MADFSLQHHGTIVILTPTSPAGHDWLAENVQAESWQRWGQCSVAIEPRYAPAIVDGFLADGLDLS